MSHSITEPLDAGKSKRNVTIQLDAELVAQVEYLKGMARRHGHHFSVSEIYARTLQAVMPQLRADLESRSNVVPIYRGNRADDGGQG